MSNKFPDFMNMDLSKMTWSGCLLIVLSVGVIFAAAVGAIYVLKLCGVDVDSKESRTPKVVGVVIGVAVAGAFFNLGKYLLERMGLSIQRREDAEGHTTRRRAGKEDPES
jgi:hypothetical protein